jgi:alpha-tubulin suppressor-like RCC1 family protein
LRKSLADSFSLDKRLILCIIAKIMAISPTGRILALCCLCASIFVTAAAVVPGHVETWGNNVFGQATSPAGLDGVIGIAAGSEHSLALLQNGTVIGWGNNSQGQITPPAGLNNVIAIAAGLHSVALKSDGSLVAWGSNNSQVMSVPAGLQNVVAISARGNFALALKDDGTVLGWGTANSGQTSVPQNLSGVVKISAGYSHCLALKSDHTVVTWGASLNGLMAVPADLNDVVSITAGFYASFAIKSDGSVVHWGDPGVDVNAKFPTGLNHVLAISVGANHAIALLGDGSVAAWGGITTGTMPLSAQAAPGAGFAAISSGDNHDLYLTARPQILGITPPIKATAGATLTLTLSASGSNLQYQWKKNGADMPGQNAASLVISSAAASDAAQYTAVVSNPSGSLSADTSIFFDPPTIQARPTNTTVYRAETARFSVTANGLDPFHYEWRHNGVLILTTTNSTLSITNVHTSDAGIYQVTVIDAAGGSVGGGAILSVIDPTGAQKSAPLAFFTMITPNSTIAQGGNPQGTNTILSGTRNNKVIDRALLQFNLSSVPTNAVVTSARVQVQVVKIPRFIGTSQFTLFRMLTPWSIAATWYSPQPDGSWFAIGCAPNSDYISTGSASKPITGLANYEFGSTPQLVADVQSWINDSSTNHGWLLKADSESVLSARHFSTAPTVVIDYTAPPAPPTIASARQDTGDLLFGFDGSPGRLYRLESRDNVDQGAWTPVTSIPSGAATNTLFLRTPINAARRFYRLTVE